MNKIAIIGSGGMGSACGNVLTDNKNDVIIYGINESELNDLKNGKNKAYFNDLKLNKFNTTQNLEEALIDVNYIILAVPTKFLSVVFENVLLNLKSKAIIINVAKGFWPKKFITVHDELKIIANKNENVVDVITLIGPSFATEIVKKQITYVAAIGQNYQNLLKVQAIFENNYFHVIPQNDEKGAIIGSIYKNIIAIASGMLEAIGYNINTQASFITYAIKEMIKYIVYCGGNRNTAYEITGLGDIILTATSPKSRNYTYGKNFLKNNNYSQITIEGVESIKMLYENIIKLKKLELPIISALYKIIFLNENPNKILIDLLNFIPKNN